MSKNYYEIEYGGMSKESYYRLINYLESKGLVLNEEFAIKTKATICIDCLTPFPRMFTLTDELWKSICTDVKDVLCMECVIKRLGRKLELNDFNRNLPINKEYILLLGD